MRSELGLDPLLRSAFLASISWETMLLALALPISLAVGFAFGILYERWYQATRLQRLRERFEKLFTHVAGLLQQAERACELLAKQAETQSLTPTQSGRLQTLTDKLAEHFRRLLPGSDSRASATEDGTTGFAAQATDSVGSGSPIKSRGKRFVVPTWSREPVDAESGLPGELAFEQNLRKLLQAAEQTSAESGVLVVELDQYSRLENRFGPKATHFVCQVTSLVLRRLRECDHLARVREDLLIALLPGISRPELEQRGHAARLAVRQHPFQHPDPEVQDAVFVTASFGILMLEQVQNSGTEPAAHLLELADQALRASRKHGRCQLHEITPIGSSRLIPG